MDLQNIIQFGSLQQLYFFLLEYPDYVNNVFACGKSPLILAAELGQSDKVFLLMERGASVDYVNPLTNKTALLYAIDESNFYDVENLVKRMLIVHRLICYGATTIFHNDSMDRKVIMFIGHMALTNFRSILFPDLRK